MDLEKLNHWLTLLANLGVIAGIAFLAIEIRQNTEALYGQSRQAIYEGVQQELFKFMEYPELMPLMASTEQELTVAERVQIDALLVSALRAREYSWQQYKAGILDEASWETERQVIAILVGSERTRSWWNAMGKLQFGEQFSNFVSDIVETEPLTPYYDQMMAW